MHLPERWGLLQFSDSPPETAGPVRHPEWEVRQVAMAVYYAQHNYATSHGGSFTDDVLELVPHLSWPDTDPGVLVGECTGIPRIVLG